MVVRFKDGRAASEYELIAICRAFGFQSPQELDAICRARDEQRELMSDVPAGMRS